MVLTASGFLVKVTYREPTYACASGTERNYTWTYRIAAKTESEAQSAALSEFHRMESLSSVGWIREVVQVNVAPAN